MIVGENQILLVALSSSALSLRTALELSLGENEEVVRHGVHRQRAIGRGDNDVFEAHIELAEDDVARGDIWHLR